jgi:dipeptidase E
VPTQNAFLQKICLRHLLQSFDGIVMGISAGAMNCAEVVYAQPEEPGESSPDFQRSLPGLGLVNVNILPHYQKIKDNMLDGFRLIEDLIFADSWDRSIIALPDHSYVYCDNGYEIICGESYRIRNGILEKLTDHGQTLPLEWLH